MKYKNIVKQEFNCEEFSRICKEAINEPIDTDLMKILEDLANR